MSNQITAVQSVLTGSGNQALYVSGNPGGLAAGQVGVFDENGAALNTAANGTTVKDKIFIAVGLGNGKFRQSPGYIQKAQIKAVNFQCYTAPVTQIVDIADMCTECSGERYIKIIITSSNAWAGYGFNKYVKTFAVREDCCVTTPTCEGILRDFISQINSDSEGLFTATATDPSDDSELNDAAITAWDYTANGCPNLRITGNATAVSDFVGIPETYTWPTDVAFEVVAKGFSCCADGTTVTTSRAVTYAEGAGADVKYLEYIHAGNTEVGPYRQTASGVVTDVPVNAVATDTYHQMSILYDEPISSEMLSYNDPKEVLVALPVATVATTLWTVLDEQLGTGLVAIEAAC